MLRLRRSLSLISLMALLMGLLPFLSVSAQAPTDTPAPTATPQNYQYTISFLTDDGGAAVSTTSGTPSNYGTWVTGSGWVSVCTHELNGAYNDVLSLTVPTPLTNFTYFVVHYVSLGNSYSGIGTGNSSPLDSGSDIQTGWVTDTSGLPAASGNLTIGQIGSYIHVQINVGISFSHCLSDGGATIKSIDIFAFGVPTLTPSITPTPYTSPTPYGGVVPPIDLRPQCSPTPIMTNTPSRTPLPSVSPWPSSTPNPSQSPTPTINGADLYGFITATPSPTRVDGDCSAPYNWLDSSTQIPIIELPSGKCVQTTATPALTEESTFVPGSSTRCREDCYTVLPDVDIGFSAIASVINFFTGQTTIDPGTSFTLEKTTYCFQYESLTLKTMGYDWSPWLEMMATVVMGLWLIERMSFKP